MGQLTQTTTELQAIVDNSDAANVGKTSLTDGSDTTAVAFKKSGFYSLQGSSSNAPSTDRAVLISAIRDTAATGEIRYGQIAITESNGLWWNRDDGGSLGTWYAAVSTTGTQTLTNKTLTSPVLTTPQINDSAADHQYIFAGSNLVADRTITLPLLTGDDTFVFEAHTQTLTNKTLTSPVFNTGVSGTAVLDADDFTGASATTLATSESIKAYVDSQVGTVDTLAEVLANGNATDGTNVVVTAGDVITTDTISETTAAAGVTIDSVLLKDDGVNATNLEVTNIKANDGTAAGSIADSTGVMTIASSVLTTADINAGTIDGTVIGGTTPAAITGTAITATGIMTATGTSVFASLDISGDIDVDGTTNLDVVDIDGAVQADGTITVGVDDTGYDVKFFGATTGKSLLWDESADTLIVTGDSTVSGTLGVTGVLTATSLDISGDIDVDGTTNLDVVDIDGAVDFGSTTAHAGNATFADNAKAIFGAGSDLQIYHDASDSIINDNGTGSLKLQQGGSTKLEVTATGIDVTGTVTADNAEIGTLGASDANAIIDLTGDTTYTDFGFRIIRNSGANGRTDLRHRGTGDFVIETVEAAEIAFETSDTERMRIDASGNVKVNDGYLEVNTESAAAAVVRVDYNSTDSIRRIHALETGGGNARPLQIHAQDVRFRDDTSERMRIDASGNLLVGKSASAINTDGVELLNSGRMFLTTTSLAHVIRRKSTDGSLVEFQKDGTTVGSIGVIHGNNLTVGGAVAGHIGLQFGTGIIYPTDNTGAANDNAVALGDTNNRFTNLYLSGGVYLGGTGAANLLDDYEEGTWTPNIAFGGASVGVTYFAQQGYYTKVGRLVQATGKLYVNSVGSSTGDFTITGLPFTLSASANSDTAVAIRTEAVSYADVPAAYIVAGTSYITFTETTNAGTGSNLTNSNIAFGSLITFTASYFV
jgi:hypothetical protein